MENVVLFNSLKDLNTYLNETTKVISVNEDNYNAIKESGKFTLSDTNDKTIDKLRIIPVIKESVLTEGVNVDNTHNEIMGYATIKNKLLNGYEFDYADLKSNMYSGLILRNAALNSYFEKFIEVFSERMNFIRLKERIVQDSIVISDDRTAMLDNMYDAVNIYDHVLSMYNISYKINHINRIYLTSTLSDPSIEAIQLFNSIMKFPASASMFPEIKADEIKNPAKSFYTVPHLKHKYRSLFMKRIADMHPEASVDYKKDDDEQLRIIFHEQSLYFVIINDEIFMTNSKLDIFFKIIHMGKKQRMTIKHTGNPYQSEYQFKDQLPKISIEYVNPLMKYTSSNKCKVYKIKQEYFSQFLIDLQKKMFTIGGSGIHLNLTDKLLLGDNKEFIVDKDKYEEVFTGKLFEIYFKLNNELLARPELQYLYVYDDVYELSFYPLLRTKLSSDKNREDTTTMPVMYFPNVIPISNNRRK